MDNWSKYAVTVDIGTTNTKVSLFEIETAKLINQEIFKTFTVRDDYGVLFHYEKILKEIINTVRKFVKKGYFVDSISFATVGESGVLFDKSTKEMTPMIVWYDKRSVDYVEQISNEEAKELYNITGLPAHTNYSLSKIRWMIDYYALDVKTEYLWLSVPDVFVYLLTGQLATEYSIASRTLCFDLNHKSWSSRCLEIFGVHNVTFPKVYPAGETLGILHIEGENQLNEMKIQVKIAGHDHKVGAYGLNLQPGDILNSTGTTEGLLQISEELKILPDSFNYSLSNGVYTNPEQYTIFSSMPCGGNVFEWYTDIFKKDFSETEHQLESLAKQYHNQSISMKNNVVIIPHFKGSGAPFKSSESKAMAYKLDFTANESSFLFGLLLGLVLEMKNVAQFFDLSSDKQFIIIGPATKNSLWLQMKADILQKEIKIINMDEVVSFGALCLAYKSNRNQYMIDSYTVKPNLTMNDVYKDLFVEYLRYYIAKNKIVIQGNTKELNKNNRLL